MRNSNLAALATSALALSTLAAEAHPHVFVSVKNSVVFDQQTVTSIDQAWSFDETYTIGAIEGLDKNKDGQYSREELTELAQVNIDGLKEFDYFTYANKAGEPVKFAPPKDYWLDYAGGVLTLHLTLPLEKPLELKASAFTYSVNDPTFFIAFDFAKDDPVKTAGTAGSGCKAALKLAAEDAATANLSDAFGVQMEGQGTVDVSCAE